jgi:hypothetical protein
MSAGQPQTLLFAIITNIPFNIQVMKSVSPRNFVMHKVGSPLTYLTTEKTALCISSFFFFNFLKIFNF